MYVLWSAVTGQDRQRIVSPWGPKPFPVPTAGNPRGSSWEGRNGLLGGLVPSQALCGVFHRSRPPRSSQLCPVNAFPQGHLGSPSQGRDEAQVWGDDGGSLFTTHCLCLRTCHRLVLFSFSSRGVSVGLKCHIYVPSWAPGQGIFNWSCLLGSYAKSIFFPGPGATDGGLRLRARLSSEKCDPRHHHPLGRPGVVLTLGSLCADLTFPRVCEPGELRLSCLPPAPGCGGDG